jgi:ribonuclease HI
MTDEHAKRKQDVSLKWIKADSGNTYLCPVDKLSEIENPTEEQLKAICVDESENPQND